MELLLIGIFVGFVLAFVAGMRVSMWHNAEAEYWSAIGFAVQIDPDLDGSFRPILDWTKANPPSLWERMHTWQAPTVRMERHGV